MVDGWSTSFYIGPILGRSGRGGLARTGIWRERRVHACCCSGVCPETVGAQALHDLLEKPAQECRSIAGDSLGHAAPVACRATPATPHERTTATMLSLPCQRLRARNA